MDESYYHSIINSISVINNPYSSSADRTAAESFCEEFQKRQDCAGYIFYILTNPSTQHTDPVKHFALSSLRNMIISKWDSGFTDQQKIEMKQFILYYFKELLKPMDQESNYVRSKFADVACEVLKREWPQRWETFHTEIIQYMHQDTQHFYMGIVIFERLCSEVSDTSFNSRLSAKRRSELNKGIGVITGDLINLSKPFLPRKNLTTPESAYQKSDSRETISIAHSIIRLLKSLIPCANTTVFEENFVFILSKVCPWCIYDEMVCEIIDFIFTASQAKWLKEHQLLYLSLYESMLELYLYMNKFYEDITTYYDLWKQYYRTFSNMIPTLPPPRVDAKNEVYVHIYQLFVSLCNHPSITIVDIILTNLAQLFAEISFKHALQPVYKESMEKLFENLYLRLSQCNDYHSTNPLIETLNELDFEDESKYSSFLINFKNRAKVASEGIARRFPYLCLEAVNSLLPKYWKVGEDKHLYKSLSLIIEGILNGCTYESIKSFPLMANLGVNILTNLLTVPLPSSFSATSPPLPPLYLISTFRLLVSFHSLFNFAPQFIPTLLALCFDYAAYRYPSQTVATEEVEELNRTAAQTLTKLSTYEGQLFMDYLEQMAQRTAQLNADPDLRGSIKTAFIQALLNINKFVKDEQSQFTMIYTMLEPSFKYLSSAEFRATLADPSTFMNLYTTETDYPSSAFYTFNSHVFSILTILSTISPYVDPGAFLQPLLTELFPTLNDLIVDLLYSISMTVPHQCTFTRGWTDMEVSGVKTNSKITTFYMANVFINLFSQVLSILRLFTMCPFFYQETYMSALTRIITNYGSIFRYNHLRMWFVNVVIPLCFNAHSPEAIHSIMEVVSVSTQLCHQFLTSEPLQPYPTTVNTIPSDELDIVFNYNRIKLLYIYMDSYLYQCAIKYKGYMINNKEKNAQKIQQKRDEDCLPLLQYFYCQDTSLYQYLTVFMPMCLSCQDEYIFMQALEFLQKFLPLLSSLPTKDAFLEEIFSILVQRILLKPTVIKGREWTMITLISQIYRWLIVDRLQSNQQPSQNIIHFIQTIPGCTEKIYRELEQNAKNAALAGKNATETSTKDIFKEFLDKILDANESSVGILGQVKPIRDIPEQLIIKQSSVKIDDDADFDLKDTMLAN